MPFPSIFILLITVLSASETILTFLNVFPYAFNVMDFVFFAVVYLLPSIESLILFKPIVISSTPELMALSTIEAFAAFTVSTFAPPNELLPSFVIAELISHLSSNKQSLNALSPTVEAKQTISHKFEHPLKASFGIVSINLDILTPVIFLLPLNASSDSPVTFITLLLPS